MITLFPINLNFLTCLAPKQPRRLEFQLGSLQKSSPPNEVYSVHPGRGFSLKVEYIHGAMNKNKKERTATGSPNDEYLDRISWESPGQ